MKRTPSTCPVIPGLTRNPVMRHWIPAFAGMTNLCIVFHLTTYQDGVALCLLHCATFPVATRTC
ncbi:MAG: hypothetical protein IPI44_22350 [Sulfuritalea sp.]|nr:hypothetical protein [Sulfuritalea sp.]